MQVAAEQSAGNGKCNLRRLKKQFKALKSTFTVYDMKEGFIDGQLPRVATGSSCGIQVARWGAVGKMSCAAKAIQFNWVGQAGRHAA